MRPRGHVGFSPYLAPRGRVGAPLIAASPNQASLTALGSFATAQGGQPTLLQPPAAAMRGTRTYLAFASAILANTVGAQSQVSTTSQGVFRTSRMIVSNSNDTTGNSVLVAQILVGSENVFANGNAVPSACFQASAVECGITFPTAGPGITIYVTFQNTNATTTTVFATLLGEYIQGGGPEIGG